MPADAPFPQCYRSAWQYASSFSASHSTPSTESHIVALHQALIPNWTSPAFSKFVDATRALVDELANITTTRDGKEEMQRCEEIFRQICWLEERFWPDVDGMGEEDESARLGPGLGPMGAGMDGSMADSMNGPMNGAMNGPMNAPMSGPMNAPMSAPMNNQGMNNPGMNTQSMNNQSMSTQGMNGPSMNGPGMNGNGMNGPGMNGGDRTPVGDGRNSFSTPVGDGKNSFSGPGGDGRNSFSINGLPNGLPNGIPNGLPNNSGFEGVGQNS